MIETLSPEPEVEKKLAEEGIEWIQRIPTSWEVLDLKWCCDENKTKNEKNVVTNVLSLSYGKIIRRDVESNFGLLPASFEGYQVVEPGHIVLRLTDLQNDKRSLRVGAVNERGIITSAYVGVKPQLERLYSPFIYYLLHSYDLAKVFYSYGGGVRQSMSFEDLKTLPLLIPPLPTQKAIANFLDRKTAAIDTLIEKKEKLLKLLAEKRSAVINQAVTKGLDPTVPMKDSGIPWIGEIPGHWEMSPLGYRVSLQGGSTPSKLEERFWGGDIPWVSPKDMKRFEIDDSLDKITKDALQETSIRLIPPGATLVVVRGMILARTLPVGLSMVPCTINQDMKAIIPSCGLDARYLSWQLNARTQEAMSLIEEAGHGTKTFRTDLFTKMKILIPPLAEQDQIIETLEKYLTAFDSTEANTRLSNQKLHEYRQSLITAAVTGQLDIPAEDFES